MTSEPGSGSRFVVTLHALERPSTAPRGRASPDSDIPTLARARILVIDDEPQICELVERMLMGTHEVVLAHAGEEAIDILVRDTDFDIVLCDVMMPGITGVDLYEWLEAHCPALTRRVVFISGGVFTPKMTDFFERISTPIVTKPFDTKTLFRTIEQVLCSTGKAAPTVISSSNR